MTLFSFSILVGIVTAACICAVLWTLRPRMVPERANETAHSKEVVLLFRGSRLIDADDAVWPLIEPISGETASWEDVKFALESLVPDLPETLPTAPQRIAHTAGPLVEASCVGDAIRLTLRPVKQDDFDWFLSLQATAKLKMLRPALRHAPNPIWCAAENARIIWSNDAFDALARDFGGAENVARSLASTELRASQRAKLTNETRRCTRWFDVSQCETEYGVVAIATSVDAVVRAEEAQRNFVQTLSKTFANLTTGLAIFDRNRRLALFNPALIDLSGLPVEFLSGRPNLFEFFDKLRDQQIMPEPKNYDNWRECMAKLIAAASDDRFRETWNLADGQTFDVTGRPYPDGAIAFLFNDITAEVSLTRGFRTELETMQSSLDVLEDAVAVFNQQGVLVVSNLAYKVMWQVDPDTSLIDATIVDATQEWKSAFHPAPVWPEIRDFVTRGQDRASWDTDLRAKDGREIVCTIDPIIYGSTMIRFRTRPLRRADGSDPEPLQIVSA